MACLSRHMDSQESTGSPKGGMSTEDDREPYQQDRTQAQMDPLLNQ